MSRIDWFGEPPQQRDPMLYKAACPWPKARGVTKRPRDRRERWDVSWLRAVVRGGMVGINVYRQRRVRLSLEIPTKRSAGA